MGNRVAGVSLSAQRLPFRANCQILLPYGNFRLASILPYGNMSLIQSERGEIMFPATDSYRAKVIRAEAAMVAAVETAARASAERAVAALADRMVQSPSEIGMAVYGVRSWPATESVVVRCGGYFVREHQAKTPTQVLADCRAKIESARANVGHWAVGQVDALSLRAAERALLRMGAA